MLTLIDNEGVPLNIISDSVNAIKDFDKILV